MIFSRCILGAIDSVGKCILSWLCSARIRGSYVEPTVEDDGRLNVDLLYGG